MGVSIKKSSKAKKPVAKKPAKKVAAKKPVAKKSVAKKPAAKKVAAKKPAAKKPVVAKKPAVKKAKTEIKRVERKSPTLGMKAPEGAIVLFDGSNTDAFDGKVNVSDKQENAIWSEARLKPFEKDRPYTLHMEFMLSFMPNATGQARSNSGVYLQEEYECQVLDSFGLEGENNECAGFYQQLKPIVNACFPPLTWQTYDFDVTPAKFNDKGEKIANAVITVKHNGILVHDKAELAHETPGGKTEKTEAGEARGVFLQGHGNKVQYRNIWIKYND